MLTGLHFRWASVATALSIALASPAMAEADFGKDDYDASIQGAKREMVADPAKALDFARKAKHLPYVEESEAVSKERLVADWLEGEALMRLNRGNEAAGIIGFALFEASQHHGDDPIYADLLRSSASLKAQGGDPAEAMAHFKMAAERYQQLGNKRSYAIVLQNIGSLYSQSDDFAKVLEYYRMAAEVYSDDAILSLSALNNIANALKGMGQYDEARQHFNEALAMARKMESPLLEARILTNLASTQHLAGDDIMAKQTAQNALTLAKQHAPDWTPFIYGVLAQIEFSQGDVEEADSLITMTFAGRELDATDALFREFHDTASQVFARAGKADLAKAHADASKRLFDQARRLAI